MFQRQTKQAFPARNIILLAAAALALLSYLAYEMKQSPNAPPPPKEEKPLNGLWPAEWFFAIREYPYAAPDVDAYTSAMRSAAESAAERNTWPGFQASWTVEGPNNIGGRINTIKVNPVNPNIIYIGYSNGGVFKTINGGNDWFPVFDEQPFLCIGDIELDPQNPNIVYVGTGDPNISGYPFVGNGLYKSVNGGQSWSHIGLADQRIISKILPHPTNPNILYAAAMGLPFARNNERGFYKTIDGGQNWQQVLAVSDETGAIDAVMSHADPNTIYVAMWDRIRNNQESVAVSERSKVWKTGDGGANWAILDGGLPQTPQSRIGLDMDAQNANHLLAIYAGPSLRFNGVYETWDGGQSWAVLDTAGLDPDCQSNFSWYFGKIHINPYNPQDIYLPGVELWRTVDGGNGWFRTVPPWWQYQVHADGHDMAFIDGDSYLYATDGGLYRTDDSGFSWYKFENIPSSQFYRVAFNPFTPEYYYGGAQDNGTTAGNYTIPMDWPRLYGGDGFQAAFHPSNPDIFYYEYQNGSIVGTVNAGQNYSLVDEGFVDSVDRRNWDMQYFISSHDPDLMYTGSQFVYQGYGHFPVWFPISDDLTDGNIFGARFHTISTLSESPLDPEILYAGTTDGNVWVGNPFNFSWTNISANLPDRYVSCVKASPNLAQRVFVSHTGYRDNDATPRLHRSDDLGQNWTPISGDLPNVAINDILVLPGRQDSVILVATDAGVYGTLNGGLHWERLGANMPNVPVYDLEVNPVLKTVFAGTFARSIYSFPLDSIVLGVDVSTFTPSGAKTARLQVSPNPAQTYTTVRVAHLSARQQAEVLLCDGSGRILQRLQFSGGQVQEMRVDVTGMPPGVYFAIARTAGKVWGTEKFVVTR